MAISGGGSNSGGGASSSKGGSSKGGSSSSVPALEHEVSPENDEEGALIPVPKGRMQPLHASHLSFVCMGRWHCVTCHIASAAEHNQGHSPFLFLRRLPPAPLPSSISAPYSSQPVFPCPPTALPRSSCASLALPAMARSEAILGVHPVRFVDDVYNFTTQYVKRSVDSLEGTLADDEETRGDALMVRNGCAGCQVTPHPCKSLWCTRQGPSLGALCFRHAFRRVPSSVSASREL